MRALRDMTRQRPRSAEGGFFLIEAMVALLIFALGILGLVAMGGTAVSSQSDAQYRTEASGLADAIASQIALGVDRTNSGANIPASLANFATNTGGANCAFNGGVTGDAAVSQLIGRAQGLPGGLTPGFQQILIDPLGSFNRVQITLCWRAASDAVPRRHTVITYVN